MIVADQIAKRFLIIGVVLAAVCPRMPHDKRWSIGGGLSNGFRKLLLAIVAVNFSRLLLSGNEEFSRAAGLFSDLLGVVEVTGLTFLCFLTPYVLETRLTHFTNVRPGSIFYYPLIGAAVLSLLGVVLSRTVHPNLWCLKKLANAISGPPVISVLLQFNRVSTARAHGNGFMIGQAALTIEYWHFWLQLFCFLGYACDRHVEERNGTWWDSLMLAARSTAFMGDWTRVLMHALFLNGMDEMDSLHVFDDHDDETPEDSGEAGGETALVEVSSTRRLLSSLSA
ncbi:hypothetical protein MHU86_3008 [Fragilaria crotonensis]|nr:hypothetical protein MHU86_3008 [Fragilaria crotonensis]